MDNKKLVCFPITEEIIRSTLEELNMKVLKINIDRHKNIKTELSDFKGVFSFLAQAYDKEKN